MSLLDLTPHQVSRDLRGYSVMFYGDIKTGKTTIASKFPNSLILAFEKGYSALPGVYAKPINNWGEFLQTMRELKDPEVKSKFETIVIDTADIAYEYVEEYICNVEGVDAINKIPYGQGWGKSQKEFDTRLRKIVQMGYGLVIISHAKDKTFQNEDGTEYNKIVSTLGNQARLVVSRMCDIIGYSRIIEANDQNKTFLFMRGTPRFEAGSRFKYTPDKIEFTYDNLVNAIGEAIDKQMQEDGEDNFTDKRDDLHLQEESYDYEELKEEFFELAKKLVEEDPEFYPPRITAIVEKTLGKGKKMSDATIEQGMLISIILSDLRELKK